MPALLVSVRFHDGRYHGMGDWPPSPARLFQALVAGAARGQTLPDEVVTALTWLERLAAPFITAPSAVAGRSFRNFVPNNDLDAVGGDPVRTGSPPTASRSLFGTKFLKERPATADGAVMNGAANLSSHVNAVTTSSGSVCPRAAPATRAWNSRAGDGGQSPMPW